MLDALFTDAAPVRQSKTAKRLANRKIKRLTGQIPPRMRPMNAYLHRTKSAFVLPDLTVHPVKRIQPEHEKPSTVEASRGTIPSDYRCFECQKAQGRPYGRPHCEPRLHDVESRRLPETRSDPKPEKLRRNTQTDGVKPSKSFNTKYPKRAYLPPVELS